MYKVNRFLTFKVSTFADKTCGATFADNTEFWIWRVIDWSAIS